MSFFKNLSGKKWTYQFLFNGLYGSFYTPWFGWSYNIHPNRLQQIWNCHFRKQTVFRPDGVKVCAYCSKLDGHKF